MRYLWSSIGIVGRLITLFAWAFVAILVLTIQPVNAGVTGTWQVNLLRGTSKIETPKGATQAEAWDKCVARIADPALINAGYKCQTPVYVATKTPDPAPNCTIPKPDNETRSQSCPTGTTGSWPQTRTYASASYPTCWSAGDWTPSAPPARDCAPVVEPPPSGDTITHGEAMAITGSGFGTKPKAAPLVFDDFEAGAGSLEGKAAVVGAWDSGDYCKGVSYATYEGRKVARHDFTGGRYNASLCKDPKPATATFYLNFWIKGVPLGNPSRNWKWWRTYDASGSNENGDLVHYCGSSGLSLGGHRYLPDGKPPTEWVNVQVISTPFGTAHYRNGKPDSVNTRAGNTVGEIRLGHYWANDADENCAANPGANVYTDDVYVDTSIARVYLANAPTFAAAGITAIQVPKTWADGRVEYTANTHRFKAGDTVYEIVFTASNVEKAGKKLTVR